MRAWCTDGGLTVRAIAGTHTVLLSWDLVDANDCLGFGILRTDHTEDERYWLRGLKTFPSIIPFPTTGSDYSTREHPIQGFQWGDYTAKPEHDYTYRVVGWTGKTDQLTALAEASIDVRTEAEDDGVHGIWFNRGVAGSQAFVRRFGDFVPPVNASEDHPAFAWLSRGLAEAFVRFVARASDAHWGLRGAFYEFTWHTALRALADAEATGADVRIIVHGRDTEPSSSPEHGGTAVDNRKAVKDTQIDHLVTWRTAPNKGALQHNKFLVLTHEGRPVAVWTGSMNLTQGGVFGHLNVGHLISDPRVAAQFLAYWTELEDQDNTTPKVRAWTETSNHLDLTAHPKDQLTAVFSPRHTKSSLLQWYADIFDSATSSSHITGAFGLNRAFLDRLAVERDVVRNVLLDKPPDPRHPIPMEDHDVRISWGDYLHHPRIDQWAGEHLTGFNKWVKFIHTKVIIVDPMTESPTVITGSANYSESSTVDNEENSVVITGGDSARRVADIYLTEYHRLFTHFVFRGWASRGSDGTSMPMHLTEDSTWSTKYFARGSWRERQRRTFAGTGAKAPEDPLR